MSRMLLAFILLGAAACSDDGGQSVEAGTDGATADTGSGDVGMDTAAPDGAGMDAASCSPGCQEVCEGGSCECLCPTACTGDGECAVSEVCDLCAYPSCPACDDCNAACVPHGCPTEAEPLCDSVRPECGPGGVAVVLGGCWECVRLGTCQSCTDPCTGGGPECGGLEGLECPAGNECIDDPRDDCDPSTGGADCGGVCAPLPPSSPECGGIAGGTCAFQQECIDDPRDDCDPATGGADCAGLCVPKL